MSAKPAAPAVGWPKEAAMIGTFLISVLGLIIAVLGCAWLRSFDHVQRHTDDGDTVTIPTDDQLLVQYNRPPG